MSVNRETLKKKYITKREEMVGMIAGYVETLSPALFLSYIIS